MRPLKILPAALALVGVLALSLPAWAGPEEGEDIEAKIKAQMDKIIQLMEENEAAILKATTGGKAEPKKVDVVVPPSPEAAENSESSSGSSGGKGSGEAATKKLGELIKKSRGAGGQIPGELDELIRMVPQ